MSAGNPDRIVTNVHPTGEPGHNGEILVVRAPAKAYASSSGGATPGARPLSSPVRTPRSGTLGTLRIGTARQNGRSVISRKNKSSQGRGIRANY